MSKKNITTKKETVGYVAVGIALVACCLFLPLLIAGGTLTFVGGYFNNTWLLVLGIGIIVLAVIAILIRMKKKAWW